MDLTPASGNSGQTTRRADQPIAGWYDDPAQPGWMRYWDGEHWTLHRQPMHDQPAGGRSAPGSTYDPLAALPTQSGHGTAREYEPAAEYDDGQGPAMAPDANPAVAPQLNSAEALQAPPPSASEKPRMVPHRTRVNPHMFTVGKGLMVLLWVTAWLCGFTAVISLWGSAVHGAPGAYIKDGSTQNGVFDVVRFVTVLHLVPLAVAVAATWMVWQYNVAQAFPRPSLRTSPDLQIAWWFVPIINLWLPYPDVANLNENIGSPNSKAVLNSWWACFVLTQILVLTALGLTPSSENPQDYVVQDLVMAGAAVVGAIGAALAAMVVRGIHRRFAQSVV